METREGALAGRKLPRSQGGRGADFSPERPADPDAEDRQRRPLDFEIGGPGTAIEADDRDPRLYLEQRTQSQATTGPVERAIDEDEVTQGAAFRLGAEVEKFHGFRDQPDHRKHRAGW